MGEKFKICSLVNALRNAYKHNKDLKLLTDEQVKFLEKMGMIWKNKSTKK